MTKIPVRVLLLVTAMVVGAVAPAQAQLFGESDEVKAARQAHEDSQDAKLTEQGNLIFTLTNRVRDLEESLRQATGRNEALDNRLNQLTQQLERQQRDFDYRLCTLTAKQLGTSSDPEAGGINCAAASASASAPAANAESLPGGAIPLAPPPGVLGSLPASAASSPMLGAPADSQARFDTAMNMLGRNQLTEARASFRAFADDYPEDEALSSQAIYWVGVIAFTQNDYTEAARSFAEGIKKYPKATRAPDSMLKLGQSLIAIGQKNEGCTTLGEIKKRYPDASQSVVDQATIERRNAACR